MHRSDFYVYAEDISVMSKVHSFHPEKDLYFTEQRTGVNGNFGNAKQ